MHALSVPFSDLLQPLVDSAAAAVAFEGFAPAARAALERVLLARLSAICGPALQHEFENFRSDAPPLLRLFLAGANTERYHAFVRSFSGSELPAARLISTAIAHWRDATAELVRRLHDDRAALGDPGEVIDIDAALSDPHNGGRTVAILTFESGRKVVYKPRPVAMERTFSEFLAWCNANAAPKDVCWYAPWVIDRGDYGWMEFIPHQECATDTDLRHFYRSAGGLAVILHLLGATDCHYENLIAFGRHPVLVDAETLFQPQPVPPGHDAPLDPDGWDTVMRTGLLPRWEFSADGTVVVDVSGLGGGPVEGAAASGPVWTDINTDTMSLTQGPQPMAPRRSVPVCATDWSAAIEEGFEATWRAIERVRDRVPLHLFEHCATRMIYRPTQLYVDLLQRSREPGNRDVLDVLARPFPEWSLLGAEIAALESGDVPYFTLPVTGVDVASPLRLDASAFANGEARLARWSDAALARQRAVVRGSLRAHAAKPVPFVEERIPLPDPEVRDEQSWRDEFLSTALALAAEIDDAGFDTPAGRQWVGLLAADATERYQLELIGEDLYGGACGVAVFLAAAYRASGEDRFRRSSLAALEPIRTLLRTPSQAASKWTARIGIGGACGLGSVIYSLVRATIFLGNDELLEDAVHAVRWITPAAVQTDRTLDVVGGTAGTILALLALRQAAGHRLAVDLLRRCANHLLSARSGQTGRRAWVNFAEVPLTGMAHGAAGISLALLRLYCETGRSRDLDAAREGIEYERALYRPAYRNWPDLRPSVMQDGQPGFSTAWCHGAPGIGLSRLDWIAMDAGACAEIDAAIATTVDFGFMGPDYLCCGNMGRIEFLLEAGVALRRTDLVASARTAAAALCARAGEHGGFRLLANIPAAGCKPGFFRGSAGIGYTLLRCAAPDDFPSVLLWK